MGKYTGGVVKIFRMYLGIYENNALEKWKTHLKLILVYDWFPHCILTTPKLLFHILQRYLRVALIEPFSFLVRSTTIPDRQTNFVVFSIAILKPTKIKKKIWCLLLRCYSNAFFNQICFISFKHT